MTTEAKVSKNTKPGEDESLAAEIWDAAQGYVEAKEEIRKADLKLVAKEPMPPVSLEAEGLYDEMRLAEIEKRSAELTGLVNGRNNQMQILAQEFLQMSIFTNLHQDNTADAARLNELEQEKARILARKKTREETAKENKGG